MLRQNIRARNQALLPHQHYSPTERKRNEGGHSFLTREEIASRLIFLWLFFPQQKTGEPQKLPCPCKLPRSLFFFYSFRYRFSCDRSKTVSHLFSKRFKSATQPLPSSGYGFLKKTGQAQSHLCACNLFPSPASSLLLPALPASFSRSSLRSHLFFGALRAHTRRFLSIAAFCFSTVLLYSIRSATGAVFLKATRPILQNGISSGNSSG